MDDLGGVEGCSDIAGCEEGLPSISGEETASSSGYKQEWRQAAAEASVLRTGQGGRVDRDPGVWAATRS